MNFYVFFRLIAEEFMRYARIERKLDRSTKEYRISPLRFYAFVRVLLAWIIPRASQDPNIPFTSLPDSNRSGII